MKRKRRIIPLAIFLALCIAFFLFAADYYRADQTALDVLESETITRTEYGWFFDGPGEDSVLVFYPGAKVEEAAYAPLLRCLAESGTDVCLVKMPFRLAFFGINGATAILEELDRETAYIGGHSLGGAMAAYYAAGHDLDGVILLAAYPTRELDEPVLLVYGSEDGVVNRGRLAAAGRYGQVEETVIEGGNHAGFGNYGPQKGDGEALISAEEQQRETAEKIREWIAGEG